MKGCFTCVATSLGYSETRIGPPFSSKGSVRQETRKLAKLIHFTLANLESSKFFFFYLLRAHVILTIEVIHI